MIKSICIISYLLATSLLFSQEKEAEFELCEQTKTFPYYFSNLTYKGGFWVIKQHYTSKYPTNTFQKLQRNSGIITIQFKVNCKGQTDNFIIKQCDLNYQPTKLDNELTTYFLEKTQQLKDWVPGKDENGNNVNSFKFFSFRIKEGTLLEILPK